MTCAHVQQALIDDSIDGYPEHSASVRAHLEQCPGCARVAAQQRRLDAMLTSALVPPALSATFRPSLARQIDDSSHSWTSDALPDILHLASGAVLTLAAISAAPLGTVPVVAIGTLATAGSYVVLAMLRNSFDETAL